MLYVTRSRYKESVGSADLVAVNRLIDAEAAPALRNVSGVRSAESYNSITGELVFVLDIEGLSVIDRIVNDPGGKAAFGSLFEHLVRTGGEVLYDRPTWQGLYGSSESD